jgi:hypothetical protein
MDEHREAVLLRDHSLRHGAYNNNGIILWADTFRPTKSLKVQASEPHPV